MVRYPIQRQALIDAINQTKPNWLQRAKDRTDAYRQARAYTGGSEFWGEIKDVFIKLQHEKCAYCETKLQGAELASKVHEVEHFRPKSSVKAWPPAGHAFQPGWALGAESPEGYYLLAYHPFNYAIACTRCNSTLKSNCFPVSGMRDIHAGDPSNMQGEQSLLIYPVSDIDADPAQLIGFDGVTAKARHASGAKRRRALTTIHFFQLNHQDLTTRRAEMLGQLYVNLEALAAQPAAAQRKRLQTLIERTCAPSGQFSSCMRDFVALYSRDTARARTLGQLALDMVS
jgi:hypothetical protein